MGEKKSIALSTFGLKDTDLRLLKTICALSEGRDRPYRFFVSDTPVALPTIWIVDADALPEWRAQYAAAGAMAIVFGATTDAADEGHIVQRPVTASRVMAALDAVAARHMEKLAQLVIGGNSGLVAEERAEFSASVPGYSRYTALVVDDSPTIQKQIELGLRLNGVGSICVGTGEEALEALKESHFDLIFLDIVLPGTDGYQVCRSIKRDPANKRTPVIMLTSKSSTFDRVRGSMVGCDTYLTKPVDTDTFSGIVAKYLGSVGRSVHERHIV